MWRCVRLTSHEIIPGQQEMIRVFHQKLQDANRHAVEISLSRCVGHTCFASRFLWGEMEIQPPSLFVQDFDILTSSLIDEKEHSNVSYSSVAAGLSGRGGD